MYMKCDWAQRYRIDDTSRESRVMTAKGTNLEKHRDAAPSHVKLLVDFEQRNMHADMQSELTIRRPGEEQKRRAGISTENDKETEVQVNAPGSKRRVFPVG